MPVIDSYEKMKLYCLRALGEDEDLLLKVNVSERQIQDRIADALKTWMDFHMEGSTESSEMVYIRDSDLKKGYLEIEHMNAVKEILTPNSATKSNAEVMDDLDYIFHLEYADGLRHGGNMEMGLTHFFINMEYLASMRHLFTADRLFTFNASSNRLYLHGKYSAGIGSQLVEEFRLLNWVNGTGTVIDIDVELTENDLSEGSRIRNTNAGANPIVVSFTEPTKFYPKGLRSFSVNLKQGTYTGKVKLKAKDRSGTVIASKIVQPLTYWKRFDVEAWYKEGHINDYTFEIESVDAVSNNYFCASYPNGYRNNFIFLVGYRTSNMEEEINSWDSSWLKARCVALIKKQWAMNLKKFGEIQMAGGVVLNAQAMYDEATADLEKSSEELESKYSWPAGMMVG